MTFDHLRREIERDLADLRDVGRIRASDRLSRITGQPFHAAAEPYYFTGSMTASLVLVHLYPKPATDSPPDVHRGPVPSVEEYIEEFTYFGNRHYGPQSGRTWRSRFDHNQVRFLRPFGVIDFVDGDAPDAKWVNLERSIDQKLQLQLIPYQSPGVDFRSVTRDVLEPHFQRLLDTILTAPRKYVIFCGAVFTDFVRRWVTREHKFRLTKKDGAETAMEYRFANLLIEHDGRKARAGLAPSYGMQGMPTEAYGRKCAALCADPDDDSVGEVRSDLSGVPWET